ncbi:unnamed protein product, partial [marine sediment metagenome]
MTVQAVTKLRLRNVVATMGDVLLRDVPLLTGEELFALGDIGRAELVKGELIRMSPTGHPHGYIEVNFAIDLGLFVRQHKLGRVLGGEVGIYTSRDPDTVRGAD